MASIPELDGFYYADIRLRNIPGRPREWVVGAQWQKGWKVMRVTDTDFERAVREAAALAKACEPR